MPRYRPSSGLASGIVIVAASAWGVLWVPIRVFEAQGVSGAWTLALINFSAFLVLVPVVTFTWAAQRQHARAALTIGFMTGLGLSFYGLGLVHTSVVRATLLFYLTPVWATLIGVVFLGERAGVQRWGAIALGLLGLFALVSGGPSLSFNIGDILALASGMVWAVGASLIARNGAIPVSGMVAAQFLSMPIIILVLGSLIAPAAAPDVDTLRALAPTFLAIAVFGMLPGVFLLFWAQQFLEPGRVGLLMMSEVLVAILTATWLLPEERMEPVQWLGAVLIILAGIVELIPTRAIRRVGT